ncbi:MULTISPECIES: winged helix DNA-binding protein [unclassified Burkholderia]|uniref:helix-turn-helix domain-containing protein n=1 Tax=unclassified Burkholderia TaxID=2613784 RepID=UPI000F577AC8|nr:MULTISPECIES: winged helix DNA-binding protein [unclassified Burkholderia]RQR76551.1 transcriptional regulator [Burkholderia sp. Bp9011]RQR87305.1 transcriptional regulator [Burkholderia sp. Bp9010]RQS69714.1 transcriptional regulator [Burkholderia sp. Bp8977]
MKESRKTVPKRSDAPTEPVQRPRVAERPASSHLDRTAAMRRLSDFEFRMERLAQAYYRWKAACFSAVCSVALSGDDVAVLNVVRMGDEPKRLSEIGQLLNRVDVPNLQYATRKLVKAGLIETEGKPSRKETRYRTTDAGREITDAYATLRGATLPPLFDALEEGVRDLEKMSVQMDLFASLYGQAAQVALSQRCLPTEHLVHEDLALR